jgi:hypothetical protein
MKTLLQIIQKLKQILRKLKKSQNLLIIILLFKTKKYLILIIVLILFLFMNVQLVDYAHGIQAKINVD